MEVTVMLIRVYLLSWHIRCCNSNLSRTDFTRVAA